MSHSGTPSNIACLLNFIASDNSLLFHFTPPENRILFALPCLYNSIALGKRYSTALLLPDTNIQSPFWLSSSLFVYNSFDIVWSERCSVFKSEMYICSPPLFILKKLPLPSQ